MNCRVRIIIFNQIHYKFQWHVSRIWKRNSSVEVRIMLRKVVSDCPMFHLIVPKLVIYVHVSIINTCIFFILRAWNLHCTGDRIFLRSTIASIYSANPTVARIFFIISPDCYMRLVANIRMKNRKYHSVHVGTIPKSNIKIYSRKRQNNTIMHDR